MRTDLMLSEQVNGQTVEQFTYNLQGLMQTATLFTSASAGETQVTTTTYYYDFQGNKVRTETSTSTNGGPATATITDYVVDSQNPSGYAQVLEERNGNTHAVQMSYILGNDILGQIGTSVSSLRFFLVDGHGSTRAAHQHAGCNHRSLQLHGVRHPDRLQPRYCSNAVPVLRPAVRSVLGAVLPASPAV